MAGEAGVGKTALLTRFCEDRADGARVLWGACDALFTPRPLGPFSTLPKAPAASWRRVVDRNADAGVTWVHSYVSADKAKTFCVYDAPTPEAIRQTASRNDLPVDQITEVSVLDPYFFK